MIEIPYSADDYMNAQMRYRGGADTARVRFAPSPSGYLHLGNIYSALYTQAAGRLIDAEILLRIEDIDPHRCRPEYEAFIYDDLRYMGYEWQSTPRKQSDHMAVYQQKIDDMLAQELAYPCFCSRKDVREKHAEMEAAGQKIVTGPEGPLYPETCKKLSAAERKARMERGEDYAVRLDVQAAQKALKDKGRDGFGWYDMRRGWQDGQADIFGDVVIGRKDCGVSYHLCVVMDDAAQDISLVTRGVDLLYATHIHALLQALWGLPSPLYDHHPLLTSDDGRAFSKTLKSLSVEGLRADHSRKDILNMIGALTQTENPDAKNI